MRGSVSVVLSAAMLLGAGCAGQQEKPLDFRVLDANNSGFISREEAAYTPQLRDAFDRADIDGDGRIGMAEFAIFEPRPERDPPPVGRSGY